MNTRFLSTAVLVLFLATGLSSLAWSAAITQKDSTQPRGAPSGTSSQGQPLSPIAEGFMSPAFRAQFANSIYFDWSGMMMANAMRDPGFLAALSVANKDFINYANSIPGDPGDPSSPIHEFLAMLQLEEDIKQRRDDRLVPENKLPVTADWCLRCHTPPGWLEAHSEPPSSAFPFLKGQFWGGAFREYPGHKSPFPFNPPDYWAGSPHRVNLQRQSEAEMDGVQCDFCHRAYDNFKRPSGFLSGTMIANGNGGYFVDRQNIFGRQAVSLAYDFQATGDFCGTCHDVTNPIFKTRTKVNGSVPDMLHPVERTYTEWYWSGVKTAGTRCQDCHQPMKFLGAQTWMLFPGLDRLWGNLDERFTDSPFNYDWISSDRHSAYYHAMLRNEAFMQGAATVSLVQMPTAVRAGNTLNATVRVVNNTGHKLPTGYGEGRQIWIHIRATDANGKVVFQDGNLDSGGKLIRTKESKVYEIVTLSEGYEDAVFDGYNILDANRDGVVTHHEKEFHFVLMNSIEKDNRIPPEGYNKAAYTADGAFIIPHDPKDVDYLDGQNWDETSYSFTVPEGTPGPVTVTARLCYQTFNREYVSFLQRLDQEETLRNDGRMRNIPNGPYRKRGTWGTVNQAIWRSADNGRPVDMATVTASVRVFQ